MKVTTLTRRALASRRQEKGLLRLGYLRHETDWQIVRGSASQCRLVIVDAVISTCGKYVFTKIGAPPTPKPPGQSEEAV